MTGPFVWQIMDARDVRGKSTAATTTTKEAPRERRMLKVTMTDGYSRVIVLERMRWSNVSGAGEVGKAVDARDEGFGERFETVDDDAFR